jgi:hypothetical protein
MSDKTIFINTKQKSKYGRINAVDIVSEKGKSFSGRFVAMPMGARQYRHSDDLIKASVLNVKAIRGAKEIVTGTPNSTFYYLCELVRLGLVEPTFNPDFVVIPDGKKLDDLRHNHLGKQSGKEVQSKTKKQARQTRQTKQGEQDSKKSVDSSNAKD